ncbi:hypothetical protein HMPREF1640_06800 [Prevotella sp. S7-1-8]|nr:hypothetical protein HMPREF1640_06800 [Prevotella sp. S7-1-8]
MTPHSTGTNKRPAFSFALRIEKTAPAIAITTPERMVKNALFHTVSRYMPNAVTATLPVMASAATRKRRKLRKSNLYMTYNGNSTKTRLNKKPSHVIFIVYNFKSLSQSI